MKEKITKTHEEFGLFAKNWKKILYKQNECIKTYVKDFYKFIKLESLSYFE